MAKRITRDMMKRGWRRKGLRLRLGLLGALWAGVILTIYAFAGGRHIFLEKPLSINHRGLEKRCGNCHRPFVGVTDAACATTCHTEHYRWDRPVDFRLQFAGIPYKQGIHYASGKFAKKNDCLSCHPAECHSRDIKKQPPPPLPEYGVQCEVANRVNLVLPQPLNEKTCKSCHKECKRSTRCIDCHREHRDGLPITLNNPADVFPGKSSAKLALQTPRGKLMDAKWTDQTILSFDMTRGRMAEFNCMGCHPNILRREPPSPDEIDKSPVSRTMFRHDSPGHRRYWHCNQCHVRKFPLQRDREENIFSMEACAKKCHFPDDCGGCHRFHDPIHRPNEHVDWPERLRLAQLYGTDNATLEFRLLEGGPATGEGNVATGEGSIATGEAPITTPE